MLRSTLIASLALVAGVYGEDDKLREIKSDGARISLNSPEEIKWSDGPASLPRGARISVLECDPTKEGPFVFRVKLPDGYRLPPHRHSKTERVTVISGAFFIGEGDKFDARKGHAM